MTQHCAKGLGWLDEGASLVQGPGVFQDEGILLLQRGLERWAGPRGPGSLGEPRSAFPHGFCMWGAGG